MRGKPDPYLLVPSPFFCYKAGVPRKNTPGR